MPIEVSPNVQYKSLTPNSLPAKIKKWYKSAKGGVINCMRTFIQANTYEKYNFVMCSSLSFLFLLFYFLPSYHAGVMTVIEFVICITLLMDIISNIVINSIDYILTTTYYYDMFLVIIDIVTIALILITKGYGTHISMTWIRLQFFLQDAKYIIPTVRGLKRLNHERKANHQFSTTIAMNKTPVIFRV